METGDEPGQLSNEMKSLHEECLEYVSRLCKRNHEAVVSNDSGEEDNESTSSHDSPKTRRQRQKRARTTSEAATQSSK